MNFSIDQIINLSKQGFTPQQIQAFDGAMTPTVNTPQPVYQAPQPQPVYHNTPMQIPRSGLADTSAQLLDAIKTIQNANLAQVSGQSTAPMTAEDAGLAVLGIKEGNK